MDPYKLTNSEVSSHRTGPPLVGIFLNWWLYGILCVQYYLFLAHSGSDAPVIKFAVHFIFLADTVQSILASRDIFFWFGYNFGDIAKLLDFHLSSIDLVVLDAIIAFTVQLVYCWRMWKLGKWRVIPMLISFCSFVGFGAGIAVGVVNFRLKSSSAVPEITLVPVMIWLIASAVSDIAIAVCMSYLLLSMKESEAGRTLGRRIMQILTLTIETNAITAAVAFEIVIIFSIRSLSPPATNVYLPGAYMLGKLYSNCFMVLLNQRHRGQDETTVEVSTQGISSINSRHIIGKRTSALTFAPNTTDSLPDFSYEMNTRKTMESRFESDVGH